jgi:hypothetical protein
LPVYVFSEEIFTAEAQRFRRDAQRFLREKKRERERGRNRKDISLRLYFSLSLFPLCKPLRVLCVSAVKYWSANLLFGSRSRKYSGWKALRSNY